MVSTALHADAQKTLREIKHIISLPESEINISHAIFTVEKLTDPSLDVKKYELKLQEIVNTVQKMHKETPVSGDVVSKYLYTPGAWNNYQIYSYNLEDPFGNDLNNHRLSHYLDTKKGNCVSMPTLYYLLATQVRTYSYISKAPRHLFVLERNNNISYAIEATRNGKRFPLKYYKLQWEIPKQAEKYGIYFQPMDKKEILAGLLTNSIIHFTREKNYKLAFDVFNVICQADPKNVLAIHNIKCLFAIMMDDEEYLSQVNAPNSPERRVYIDYLEAQYKRFEGVLLEYGYSKMTPAEAEEILKRVNRLKEGKERV